MEFIRRHIIISENIAIISARIQLAWSYLIRESVPHISLDSSWNNTDSTSLKNTSCWLCGFGWMNGKHIEFSGKFNSTSFNYIFIEYMTFFTIQWLIWLFGGLVLAESIDSHCSRISLRIHFPPMLPRHLLWISCPHKFFFREEKNYSN